MIVVTGANGQLGRLVISRLLSLVGAASVIAAVRDPAKAADLAALGIQVRRADYADPASLDSAFAGATKLLLISSSEVGQRVAQHRNVVEAAQRAQVDLLAYTSILHADTSTLALADEHRATEALIRESGLPFVLLRNGWYTENYSGGIPSILAQGCMVGCAADGRISSASRQDYAEAAAAVLTQPVQAGAVHELAGDDAFTLTEFASELSHRVSRDLRYVDLPEAGYRDALIQAGLPAGLAGMLANSEAGAASGGLFDDQRQLSRLIGRPTTPWTDALPT
jgi:NAD(P)H dehydrogenase (quinone)